MVPPRWNHFFAPVPCEQGAKRRSEQLELAQKKHKKDTKKVYKVDVEINKFCYNGQVI